MAQLIEYYVPDKYKKKVKWVPEQDRGRLISFPVSEKKSA